METDKYNKALNAHPLKLSDSEVTEQVNKIIAENFDKNNNLEVYKKIYSCIDLTTLSSTDSKESVWKFTEKANQFEEDHPELENVAAICVYPNMVKTVKEALTTDVAIASVAGGFPNSQTFTEIKIAETALAVAEGANEIDIVINLGMFLDKEYEEMCEEISEIKETCRKASLKVILETGALKTVKNIHNASILSLYSGADFLKTSTGKEYPGASLEAAFVMANAIKSYHKKSGNKVGIKISGGVATTEDAVKYYTILKEILGEEWMNKEYFRIGASRMVNALMGDITANE